MGYQLGLMDIVNVGVFLGLSISSYVMFYFSQKSNIEKQITLSTFTLGLGLNLIGLSHLFLIGIKNTSPIFNLIATSFGTLLTFIGIIMVFYEKSYQGADLKKRYEEVKASIINLKKKYYKQEISEEDLKSVHSRLLKELVELEVKMKKKKK